MQIISMESLTLNPMDPQCPNKCGKLVVNPQVGGLLKQYDSMYLIPLICQECGIELWIRAMPVGVIMDQENAAKVKS